jgi:hypothetical protein
VSGIKTKADAGIEVLASEVQDQESTPPNYKVVTYPADFTLEGLVAQFEKGLIEIPAFQRKFVWTLKQASRLIESFLLGLPVPAIFLYRDAEEKQQVIDGQQRLRSVFYFFRGQFGEEKKGKQTTFRLTGLDEKSPYADKTYKELQDTDPTSFNRLNNAVLRSFVIQQLDPNDNSSIYHIFERLNTGGTLLVGQEIRNCVYAGPFNDLLLDLNRHAAWRAVFGKKTEDYRLRDVELILRFFALAHDEKRYQKPMKNFLNNFMGARKKAKPSVLAEYRATFEKTIDQVHVSLGDTPFHLRTGLNAAAFDAVCVAFAGHSKKIPDNIRQRFDKLKTDQKFSEWVTSGTTDELTIQGRLERARTILFG